MTNHNIKSTKELFINLLMVIRFHAISVNHVNLKATSGSTLTRFHMEIYHTINRIPTSSINHATSTFDITSEPCLMHVTFSLPTRGRSYINHAAFTPKSVGRNKITINEIVFYISQAPTLDQFIFSFFFCLKKTHLY